MITNSASEFYSLQQQFVYIAPDVAINPDTCLPYYKEFVGVVDAEDLGNNGVPIGVDFNRDDIEFGLYAFLQPGETINEDNYHQFNDFQEGDEVMYRTLGTENTIPVTIMTEVDYSQGPGAVGIMDKDGLNFSIFVTELYWEN